MVKALSAIRIARSRLTNVVNVAETLEIDFSLGLRQGVQIYAIEFGCLEFIMTPAAAFDQDFGLMEIHARTGALEGGLDSFPADDTILNSSILAAAIIGSVIQEEAATRGGSAAAFVWFTEKSWKFKEIIGEPVLVAQNLTFRAVTKDAAASLNGAQATIYYRYVSLTDAELAEQFALRR